MFLDIGTCQTLISIFSFSDRIIVLPEAVSKKYDASKIYSSDNTKSKPDALKNLIDGIL